MQVTKAVESKSSQSVKAAKAKSGADQKSAQAPTGLRGLNRADTTNQVRRVDSYRVDPLKLLLEETNVRLPQNPTLRPHIDSLKTLIRHFMETSAERKDRTAANGLSEIIQPIRVVVKNGNMYVIDGFCRTTAIHELIAEGLTIEVVDVVQQTDSSPEAIIFTMLASANGLPVLPIERAVSYARLADELGMTASEITKKQNESGKSITLQRVEQLLLLGRAKPRIHELVLEDKIKADTAIVLIRKHRDDPDAAVKAVEEAVGIAKNTVGRTTYAVPKKHQESIVKSIASNRKHLQEVLNSVKGSGSNVAWAERTIKVDLPAGVVEQLLKQLEKSA